MSHGVLTILPSGHQSVAQQTVQQLVSGMRRQGEAKPKNRDGIWYLVHRVPKQYEKLDRRRPVRLTTDIAVVDDPRAVHAGPVVRRLDTELHAYWRGLKDGQSGEARIRFEAAQARARQLGLNYATSNELANGP